MMKNVSFRKVQFRVRPKMRIVNFGALKMYFLKDVTVKLKKKW